MGIEKPKQSRIESNVDRTPMLSDEDFKGQFVEQTVVIDGDEVSFIHIEPTERITARQVVFIGGFGTGAEEYKEEIKHIAQSGRTVLCINPEQGIESDEQDRNKMEALGIPETLQEKATEVVLLLDHLGITRADIVGHSQGAIIATVVEVLRPGEADNLVLVNPAGMHGEDTVIDITGRTAMGAFNQQIDNVTQAMRSFGANLHMWDKFGSAMRGNTMSTMSTGKFNAGLSDILKTDIVPLLKSIKEQQDARNDSQKTTIHLVTAHADTTFPPDRIEKHIGFHPDNERTSEEAFHTIDTYTMYKDKGAGHEQVVYGEPGLITQIINEKYRAESKK